MKEIKLPAIFQKNDESSQDVSDYDLKSPMKKLEPRFKSKLSLDQIISSNQQINDSSRNYVSIISKNSLDISDLDHIESKILASENFTSIDNLN